jgi:N6-L-threonylcarbamoyladenine synthase
MQNIVPVIQSALLKANITKNDLNAVAFTQGPGLLGALVVGVSFAKSFALGLVVPLIGVNHMQAHILAHFIDEPKPKFPFICLTVSGGHTQIVVVESALQMQVIGHTQDDAVGEAFDKAAKLLGLPYPGGPQLDKTAANGNERRFTFPGVDTPGLNYSFSGIKTAFMYFLRDHVAQNPHFISENINDICASIQASIVEILLKKLRKAAKQTGIKQIAIAGGVSANSWLRAKLQEDAKKYGWEVFIPAFEYCTDNAAMIAMAAHFQYQNHQFTDLTAAPMPRMAL